ncbi:glycosyltransferase [Desulfuromonas thiophila]|uniref:Rhamnosyl/mannosyltransferase n=1 Tax=Desulfuromonas thiophila TaxID=57664 RepID=A0A1G7BW14_9BACT|nr:glycosyltransferase [Desulfuromonas thiophila]SDE30566.1 rhamnosyl/mannosyltransferase [Desulfuromonas thiophila]
MRVLHVYRTYFPDSQGGLEEAIRQLCRATTSRGVQNRIFTLSPCPRPAVLQRPEAEVHRFPRTCEIASCGISVSALAGFRALVDWADLVHYQFPWPFADFLHLAACVRKPALVSYQADIVRQQGWLRLYRPLMRQFLARMAAVVATSPQYAASSPVLSAMRDRLQVIPLGLDPASYPVPSADRQQEVLRRFGRDYFLFVGVLRYYKGLSFLLEAARHAPFQVVVAGSGPLESLLHRQVRELGLSNVHFAGHVDDATKVALLQQARALVFPSHLRSEAFGMALLEGALFARPLISCEIGSGMSYINQHNQTGLIVPPEDPFALRQAMLQLYQDEVLAARLGAGAYQRFLQLFTAERMAEQYLHLYRWILGSSP